MNLPCPPGTLSLDLDVLDDRLGVAVVDDGAGIEVDGDCASPCRRGYGSMSMLRTTGSALRSSTMVQASRSTVQAPYAQ